MISCFFIFGCINKKTENRLNHHLIDTIASKTKHKKGRYDDVKRDSIIVKFETRTIRKKGDTVNVFVDNKLIFSKTLYCRITGDGYLCAINSYEELKNDGFLNKLILDSLDTAFFYINKQNFRTDSKLFVKLNDSIVYSVPLDRKYDDMILDYSTGIMEVNTYNGFRRYDTLRNQDRENNKIIDYNKLTKLNNISRPVSNIEFKSYWLNNPSIFRSKKLYIDFLKSNKVYLYNNPSVFRSKKIFDNFVRINKKYIDSLKDARRP